MLKNPLTLDLIFENDKSSSYFFGDFKIGGGWEKFALF